MVGGLIEVVYRKGLRKDGSHRLYQYGYGAYGSTVDPYFRASWLSLLERGYAPGDIYLSLERNMSCGVGKCGHCRLGPYHVCYDGPVFTCEQLQALPEAWD